MKITSGTDACELFQSLAIAWRLLTQGVALGWNLQTPSALGASYIDALTVGLLPRPV